MNRRDAIKLSTIAALGIVATTASAACPSQKACIINDDDKNKNRNVMAPVDASNLTKAELKHTPQITIGEKDAVQARRR